MLAARSTQYRRVPGPIEHDPEKWKPVFPRDKREAFARRSCSNKTKLEVGSPRVEPTFSARSRRCRRRRCWVSRGEFHRAIAAGAAADIGGIDAGGFQPDAGFARSGHRRRHVAKSQDIRRSARSLVPDRLHSERLHSQRAWERAAIEQDVLSGDEACLGPAENRASPPAFLGVAE